MGHGIGGVRTSHGSLPTRDRTTQNSSGRAYVIRAGSAYVVLDPEFWYDPTHQVYTTAIFDTEWKLLSLLGG